MDPVSAILQGATVPVDGSDPLVVLLSWLITFGIHRWATRRDYRRLKSAAPAIAVLAAVALRAAYAPMMGEPLTAAVLARALAAAGVAVLTHSQFREVVKLRTPLAKAVTRTNSVQPPTDAA